ncbi:hypothetical protein TPB0596_32170 [Tsukamurella pulmonis]|uniref:excisionase family DNA-binding protein n=1 Tax=Tsukamurella pulmonis TaxID=47312 RepID=UPI001EDEBE71|nr:excisionase family DNA-binding protein [Tsukamurella pulmonis]BDD83454.1 hypothetical protein TPB0596_32170 [Tsukamurella pulmonis]
MQKYLSISQAAQQLGVSERTIRRRVADGTLRARRFGPRLIRIEAAALDEVMA